MIDTTLICVDQKNESHDFIGKYLKNQELNFKNIIIVSDEPENYFESDFKIIRPFHENSDISKIYTGIFFSGAENSLITGSGYFPFNMGVVEKLLKNHHNGVDSTMVFTGDGTNGNPHPFFGVYSKKIINKFKGIEIERLEASYLKRLKINKLFFDVF